MTVCLRDGDRVKRSQTRLMTKLLLNRPETGLLNYRMNVEIGEEYRRADDDLRRADEHPQGNRRFQGFTKGKYSK
jgi:hypothetical protein